MTQPQNTATIEVATGISWQQWQAWLAERTAQTMTHAQIADLARQKLDGVIDNGGWWAQTVAVAYEQSIGRRAPGQRSDGTFEVSVSKTMSLSRAETARRMQTSVSVLSEANGAQVVSVTQSDTPVRTYIRLQFSDNTTAIWAVEATNTGKSKLSVTQSKMITDQAADTWRAYWKHYITTELQW